MKTPTTAKIDSNSAKETQEKPSPVDFIGGDKEEENLGGEEEGSRNPVEEPEEIIDSKQQYLLFK